MDNPGVDKNYDKAHRQTIKEISEAAIIPIFGTAAWEDRKKLKLPKTISRDVWQTKVGEEVEDTEVETVSAFKTRVEKEAAKYPGTHIKYKHIFKTIQHYKV